MKVELNLRSLTVATSIALLAAPQTHATVIVTSAIRSVTVTFNGAQSNETSLSTSGNFVHTVNLQDDAQNSASARQESFIEPLTFSGGGNADVTGLGGELITATANSTFVLDFQLDTNYFFDIRVSLFRFVDNAGVQASFMLDGPVSISKLSDGLLLQSGVLDAGNYHLEAFSNASVMDSQPFEADALWNFNLTLREVPTTSVPEPMTLALLFSGLLGMVLMRGPPQGVTAILSLALRF